MRAMVLEKFKEIMPVKDVAEPKLSDGNSAIVRVEANGICRSDWHWWMQDWGWAGIEPELPRILGHEFCGVVEETGKNVTDFKKGDRVIVPFTIGDGDHNCSHCMEGKNNLCDNLSIIGCGSDGGYGKYVNVQNADFNLVTLPESIEFFEGSVLGCRFMTSYHGIVERAGIQPGETLVVYGAGGIGMSAMHIAASMGAFVIAVDISDEKLDKARSIGANAVVNAKNVNPVEAVTEITKGGVDVSLDALGGRETTVNGVLSLKKGGRHIQIGLTSALEKGEVALPVDIMITKENSFISSLGMPRLEYPKMLSHIANGNIRLKDLITKRVSIDEAPAIISSMAEFKPVGMSVVDRWQ